MAHFHERIEWNEAEHVTFWPGHAWFGADAIVNGLFARIPEVFADWKVDVDRLLDCGPTVVMLGRYRGASRVTGRPLAPQVSHVWDLENNRVIRFQQYTDTWLFAQATGLEPVESTSA